MVKLETDYIRCLKPEACETPLFSDLIRYWRGNPDEIWPGPPELDELAESLGQRFSEQLEWSYTLGTSAGIISASLSIRELIDNLDSISLPVFICEEEDLAAPGGMFGAPFLQEIDTLEELRSISLAMQGEDDPVKLFRGVRTMFLWNGWLWRPSVSESDFCGDELFVALSEILDKEEKSRSGIRAKADAYRNRRTKRVRIPENVRTFVWRRDEGQCATCGSRERLEYDHIIPVSKGGNNTARNIELLCERCNRSKSDKV